jgi:hypothetical protein
MKKREFLAMGGAMPLMLAGCGGSTGSAPVRLVNASVGYPELGFMVQTTQATTADVAYGSSSPFENVQAGSVDITLTVGGTSAAAAQLRTINKDQRYSLVASGQVDELKLTLVAESTTTPDTGNANINVLNTSYDIGAVDVYLSTTTSLAISSLIASSVAATSTSAAQSAFSGIVAGSYYITVVGAGSVAAGISDVRFQSPAPITLTALQIYTIILTPGISGTLANAIVLTQGTTATTPTQNLPNTTARVRAITSTNGLSTSVTAVNSAGKPVTLLAANTTPQYSNYVVVNVGTLPTVTVTVNGVPTAVTPFTVVSGVSQAAVLAAGGDYTLMVYVDGSGNPLAQFITDDNTAPVAAQGVKFRLVNLASNNQGLQLSMSVNSVNIASLIPFATASAYTEISTPQTTNSVAEVFNGTTLLATHTQVMLLDNIFTDFVLSVNGNTAADIFRSASGT